MTETQVILALLFYIAVREIWFSYIQHKLLNKLMSRNYYDYKITEQVGKPEPEKPEFIAEPAEDLAKIGNFG